MTSNELKLMNAKSHLTGKFKIVTPVPENGEEMIKEKEREKIIRKEIEQIDQNSAVIVPILLVLNATDHSYCIETKLNTMKGYEKLSVEQKLIKHKNLLENYQTIQQYLIENSKLCTVIPISINNHEETLEMLQDIIIEKIESAYRRGDF